MATCVPSPVLREERRDARAARAQLLGEGALRRQLEFEFAGEELSLELLVLADVRGGHLPDAPGAEKDAEAPAVDAAVVRSDRETGCPLRVERLDQRRRVAGETESSDGEAGAIRDVGYGLGSRAPRLVHRSVTPLCSALCT